MSEEQPAVRAGRAVLVQLPARLLSYTHGLDILMRKRPKLFADGFDTLCRMVREGNRDEAWLATRALKQLGREDLALDLSNRIDAETPAADYAELSQRWAAGDD